MCIERGDPAHRVVSPLQPADASKGSRCSPDSSTALSAASFFIDETASTESPGTSSCEGDEVLSGSPLVASVARALRCAIAFSPPDVPRGIFDSCRVPGVSLEKYISRLQASYNCSDGSLVSALVLLDRFLGGDSSGRANGEEPICLTWLNVHRLFLACFVVSVKYNEDSSHGNVHYAKGAGIWARELSRMERALVQALDYNLRVTPEQYALYQATLRSLGATSLPAALTPPADGAVPNEVKCVDLQAIGRAAALSRTLFFQTLWGGLSMMTMCFVTPTPETPAVEKSQKSDTDVCAAYSALRSGRAG